MPRPSESDFVPASYGQACGHCVRSKTSCRRRIDGGPCERCLRRGKDCQPAPGGRREVGKRSASRTTRLEEKLDNLVTLLQSSAAPGRPSPGLPGTASGSVSSGGDGVDASGQLAFDAAGPSPMPSQTFPPTPPTSGLQPTPDAPPVYPPGQPEYVSHEEAEECLERFQTQQLRCFPFMHIPESMSHLELQRDRPFLWMCILCVSTKSAARQMALGAKIRQLVANKLIVQHERSVETLLGLLAYMGWANYHLGPTQPFLSMYCHLITGLTQDLGLDRMPRKADEPQHPMACLKSQHLLALRLAAHYMRTMEERRAVIAAYIITSEVSSFRAFCFSRSIDGLRWNSSMDEYLQELDAKREAPFDGILVAMARLKLIGDEVRPTFVVPRPSDQLALLQAFQVRALQARLDQVRETLSEELKADENIKLHLLDLETQIYETGLYQPPPKTKTMPDLSRLSILARCLQAARSWLDTFLGLDPARYADHSFPLWVQLSHMVTSIYRLTLLDEPGWDGGMVRESVDLLEVMDMLAQRFSRVPAQAGLRNDRADAAGGFRNVTKSLQTMRGAWEPLLMRRRAMASSDPAPEGRTPAGGSDQTGQAEMPPMDSFSAEFMDGVNGWMSDMMFSWDGIQ